MKPDIGAYLSMASHDLGLLEVTYRYGSLAYAVWIKIHEKLHNSNDGRVPANKTFAYLIASELNENGEQVGSVINELVDAGIMIKDKDHYIVDYIMEIKEKKKRLSQQRSEAGKKAWSKSK